MKDNKTPQLGNVVLAQQPPIKVSASAGLSDKQFKQLQQTLVYAAAVFGFLAGGKQPTPNKANLAQLKQYADAVLEMVE